MPYPCDGRHFKLAATAQDDHRLPGGTWLAEPGPGSPSSALSEHLNELGIQAMKISVIAGNDGALRFYQREGAVDLVASSP